MRQHLAPLDPGRPDYPAWDTASGEALAVWGPGSLVENLCATAQRRLLEMRRLGLADKPSSASLAMSNGTAVPVAVGSDTIATFLEAAEGFDQRVADLIAGLVWVEPAPPRSKPSAAPLPFAYAALKPLFATGAALERIKPEFPKLPIPPALPALLMSGEVAEAVRLGQERARASGLPTPFLSPRRPETLRRPPNIRFGRRLVAALLIPVVDGVLRSCLDQTYPSDEETEHAA
jgi:CRISPR-associated protein Csx17